MNNAVFGKTMENVRKHKQINACQTSQQLAKWVRWPQFYSATKISDSLLIVESKKRKVFLNKPIYVGFSILEISKTLMYDFHYNYMKKKFTDIKLCFTDTDSFLYAINGETDLYEKLKEDEELFDFSNYAPDHPCFSNRNKKVIGKMKDELGGKILTEFVGLRSKMYSYQTASSTTCKAKGVKKSVVKDEITHENYVDCLFNNSIFHHVQNTIQSRKQEVFSVSTNKLSLVSFDDKRYILDDGIETLPYGHYLCSE